MDAKTSSLHGDLEGEIYMKQPEGIVVKGKKEMVCRLKMSMYGLQKSTRMLLGPSFWKFLDFGKAPWAS
jgi:hypothetical protein